MDALHAQMNGDVSLEERRQATEEAARHAARQPRPQDPNDFLPRVHHRPPPRPRVEPEPEAEAEGGHEPPPLANYYELLHFDRAKGKNFNLPPGYKLKTSHSLRRAVSLWLNGNPEQKMAPYQRFKRKFISNEKAQLTMWDTWKKFFDTMQDNVLRIPSYPCANKRRRVEEDVVNNITTQIRDGLRRPPYTFMADVFPRVRRGGISEGRHSEDAEDVAQEDSGLALGTLGRMVRCAHIWNKGTELDLSEMDRRSGCFNQRTMTRACSKCRAEIERRRLDRERAELLD